MARTKPTARRSKTPDYRCGCACASSSGPRCDVEVQAAAAAVTFSSNDLLALPFALKRVQSLLRQLRGGNHNPSDVDSDLAVVLRAADHLLQTTQPPAATTIAPPVIDSSSAAAAVAASSNVVTAASSSLAPASLPDVSTPSSRRAVRLAELEKNVAQSNCPRAQLRLRQLQEPIIIHPRLLSHLTQPIEEKEEKGDEGQLRQFMDTLHPSDSQMSGGGLARHLLMAESTIVELIGVVPLQSASISYVFQAARHLAAQAERLRREEGKMMEEEVEEEEEEEEETQTDERPHKRRRRSNQ